jgi:hypothetical protein
MEDQDLNEQDDTYASDAEYWGACTDCGAVLCCCGVCHYCQQHDDDYNNLDNDEDND